MSTSHRSRAARRSPPPLAFGACALFAGAALGDAGAPAPFALDARALDRIGGAGVVVSAGAAANGGGHPAFAATVAVTTSGSVSVGTGLVDGAAGGAAAGACCTGSTTSVTGSGASDAAHGVALGNGVGVSVGGLSVSVGTQTVTGVRP